MNKQQKVVIIGSGAMGTAMAKVLLENSNPSIICVYGVNDQELADLANGQNLKYFGKEVRFKAPQTSNDLGHALKDANYVVLAVPSKIMPSVLDNLLTHNLPAQLLLINVSKGFFGQEKVSLHEGIQGRINNHRGIRGVVSLIGPSHAEEIVLKIPTAVAAVSESRELCREVQHLFTNEYFRVYAQLDVKGAMAGAAYKNVLAIASGMCAGLGYGVNTTALLLTRGLAEMGRFIVAEGGQMQTMMGLTGVGDLIVTATSNLSRNYTWGKTFVTDGKQALQTKLTVEGLSALAIIYQRGCDLNLDLPIVNFLYRVIFENTDLREFKNQLWDRQLKDE